MKNLLKKKEDKIAKFDSRILEMEALESQLRSRMKTGSRV